MDDPTDYQGNSRKSKQDADKPREKIESVVTGEVIQKPKGVGRKFKDIFFGGDFKVALSSVTADVLLPAIRNLIVDMFSKGVERVVYGDSYARRRPTDYRSRMQYNNPIYRPMDPRERPYLPDQPRLQRQGRREANDIILSSRGEAELVLERLIDIINQYEVASLADLYDLLGLPTSHVDNKWGWTYLSNVQIRQIRDGYLIDLPQLQEI